MHIWFARGGVGFTVSREVWRTVVAACCAEGWDPSSILAAPVPSARAAAAAGLMNAYFDEREAARLAGFLRQALSRPTDAYRRVKRLETGRPGTAQLSRASRRHEFQEVAEMFEEGAVVASCHIMIYRKPVLENRAYIDLRGWCQLQGLAYRSSGWLPEVPVCPGWLAPDLVGPWKTQFGRPVPPAGLDIDQRPAWFDFDLTPTTADAWADAIELGLQRCGAEDALASELRGGVCIPDAVSASPEEWFSGPRREKAAIFARVLRDGDLFEVV